VRPRTPAPTRVRADRAVCDEAAVLNKEGRVVLPRRPEERECRSALDQGYQPQGQHRLRRRPIRPGGEEGYDIGIRKVGPGPVPVGQSATFVLHPFNTGPSSVNSGSGVVVTDTLPANFTAPVTAVGAGPTWVCTVVGRVVACSYGGPSVGAQQAFPTIAITATAGQEGGYRNCTQINLNGAVDTNPQDNRDCRSYTVSPRETGTITIVKDAQPNGPQTFSFTSSPVSPVGATRAA